MARNEPGFKGAKLVGAVVDTASNPGIPTTDRIVTKTVTVALGAPSGTATVVAGSTIIGHYPAGNQDQLIDNIAISATTLTVTLAANATAANTINVTVLEP